MKTMTYGQAICDGLAVEMRRDPDIYVAGEDVGMFGGGLGVTLGLLDEFGPRRVRDTPLSETAIVGHAVGAAAAGLRPVAEIMFDDFLAIVLDELGNQAAKARYMFGGKVKIPMVLRASCGAGIRAAAQHSQSLEAWCAHVPGLKTVAPSTPADAKGLIIAAIRDDNPVVFLEHKILLGVTGEVPEGEYLVPLGKADIKREGGDVTLVTWSAMVQQSLRAAELLAEEGVSAEVVDLRTIVPLDKSAILESVAKTHRLVIVHEAVRTSGFGAEIAAIVADEGFDLLDAPIKRVTAPDTPVPFSPVLEDAYLPSADTIKAAVLALM
ncbi:MAG: alpha-ketoacid dehydrogenase subunit beta [Thermoleophilia bacterium]